MESFTVLPSIVCSIRSRFAAWPLKTGRRHECPRISQELININKSIDLLMLAESTHDTVNLDSVLRSIAIQSLLHMGSRSFSHFLNVAERYLPLLRNLVGGGISSDGGVPSLEARMD